MALKLTKEIILFLEADEIMKDNCVCMKGTCTTKYNSYLFFWVLTCLQLNGLKLRLGFGSVALKGAQYGSKHNCYGIQALAACSWSSKDHLGRLTLAQKNHFWSPDIICAALKFCYQRPIGRVAEWPARVFRHPFTTKVHLTCLWNAFVRSS